MVPEHCTRSVFIKLIKWSWKCSYLSSLIKVCLSEMQCLQKLSAIVITTLNILMIHYYIILPMLLKRLERKVPSVQTQWENKQCSWGLEKIVYKIKLLFAREKLKFASTCLPLWFHGMCFVPKLWVNKAALNELTWTPQKILWVFLLLTVKCPKKHFDYKPYFLS